MRQEVLARSASTSALAVSAAASAFAWAARSASTSALAVSAAASAFAWAARSASTSALAVSAAASALAWAAQRVDLCSSHLSCGLCFRLGCTQRVDVCSSRLSCGLCLRLGCECGFCMRVGVRSANHAMRSITVSVATRSAAIQGAPPICIARQIVACSGSAAGGWHRIGGHQVLSAMSLVAAPADCRPASRWRESGEQSAPGNGPPRRSRLS